MHLKSLKTFCDVVRLGSFSRAAEANGVSQSNVSQLVHQLEDRLGVRLVDTSRRPFVVTPEGHRYYEGCRDVVRRYEDLERQVRSIGQENQPSVTIAAIYSIGLGTMHEIVARFRQEHAGVELRVEYMHPDQVESAVLDGAVDLGVMSYASPSNQLKVWPWREEPFAIAAAPGNALAAEPSVTPERLKDAQFVMPQEGLRVRREIDRWLVVNRIEVQVAMEFDNLESVKRAIEVDEGIGLLPAPTFAAEIASGALRRIDLKPGSSDAAPFVRPLGVLSRRGESLSSAAQAFLELMQDNSDPSPANGAPRGVSRATA